MRRTTGSRYSEARLERNKKKGRNKISMWKVLSLTFLLVFALLFLTTKCCSSSAKETGNRERAAQLLNEVPSSITEQNESHLSSDVTDTLQTINYDGCSNRKSCLELPGKISSSEIMLYKDNYIVSYNTTTFCPNYVAWHLTPERVNGQFSRSNNFQPDESLSFELQVNTFDYSNSGYDRGHMCPAADNKDSREHMEESFTMTNICPQNRNLNAGAWQDLEEQCRTWALRFNDVYIVCGPIFDTDTPKTIGKPDRMQIAIPDRFFKCILIMGENPIALGFIYPNVAGRKPMRSYCMSIDEVEHITGIDFYPELEDDIENEIEAKCLPSSLGI